MTSYLNDRNIDRHIQLKILRHLDYQSLIFKKNKISSEALFKDIPIQLRDELYQAYYGKILS